MQENIHFRFGERYPNIHNMFLFGSIWERWGNILRLQGRGSRIKRLKRKLSNAQHTVSLII